MNDVRSDDLHPANAAPGHSRQSKIASLDPMSDSRPTLVVLLPRAVIAASTSSASDSNTSKSNVREVDLPDSSRYRCGYCGDSDATWLFWIRRHLCVTCRHLPEFRTICRSQVYRQFGLTYTQVMQGQADGSLDVFYVPNPRNTGRNAGHDAGSRWMFLYWQTQVQAYAEYLGKQRERCRTG